MLETFADPNAWIALATLTALEIVLGIDNIIFISILAGKLPKEQQATARTTGLALAMLMRIALLFSLTWVMQLTKPLFTVLGYEISGRDLILLIGGLFLIAKATFEIHDKLEGTGHEARKAMGASFTMILVQIAILDIVFSLDSVITAIGMTDKLPVMIVAVVIAVAFMMFSAGFVSRFVDEHPTLKILALSFLILIGVSLVGEGMDLHIPKGYIYFAMAFSVLVEMMNMKFRSNKAVQLHERYREEE